MVSYRDERFLESTVAELDQVVKNPLSPIEHRGGVGVNCELFELGVEQFVVCFGSWFPPNCVNTTD